MPAAPAEVTEQVCRLAQAIPGGRGIGMFRGRLEELLELLTGLLVAPLEEPGVGQTEPCFVGVRPRLRPFQETLVFLGRHLVAPFVEQAVSEVQRFGDRPPCGSRAARAWFATRRGLSRHCHWPEPSQDSQDQDRHPSSAATIAR